MGRSRRPIIGLSKSDSARYRRLLQATAHVAPYVGFSMLDCPQLWVDTMKVIRLYRKGQPLRDVAWGSINRLAAAELRPNPRGQRKPKTGGPA